MRHEMGHGHVACENKGDHACIGADEEEDAANDLDRAGFASKEFPNSGIFFSPIVTRPTRRGGDAADCGLAQTARYV